MFPDQSSQFISNSPLYITGSAPLRGFVSLYQIVPAAETERLSQPPVLFYEMDFFEMPQTVVLGLN